MEIKEIKLVSVCYSHAKTSFLSLLCVCLLTSISIHAQQKSGADEEDFIKPDRPTVANPAEIQKPGVLQIEYGFDSNFRSDEFNYQLTLPLTIRFAATRRILFDLDVDTIESMKFKDQIMPQTETGIGDTRIAFQAVALHETETRPALAFAYGVKLPTANEDKQLGSGRTDHKIIGLISKKFGKTDLDINAAYLNVGREESQRRADGAQLAISLSHELKNNFGLEFEISGQSLDDVLPRGTYALGALTYKVNKRLRFDTGMRFGLDREAPRFGIFAGFTLGATNPFEE